MIRRLRVLAAFFMVPLVVFVTPTQAAAATFSEWQTYRFEVQSAPYLGDSIPSTIDTIDCAFSLQHQGGYSLGLSAGYCFGLPDVTPGWTQSGEAGSTYSISVTGVDPSCSGSMTSTLAPHDKNGTVRVAGTITPGNFSVNAADCTITEVCLTLPHLGGESCQETSLAPGSEDPSTTSCANGTPRVETRVNTEPHPSGGGFVISTNQVRVSITNPDPFASWAYHVQFRRTNGAIAADTAAYTLTSTDWKNVGTSYTWNQTNGTMPTMDQVYGVEAWSRITVSGLLWNETGPPTSLGQRFATVFPPGRQDNYGGWTDPERCRFWVGPRVFNVEGQTGDDPHANLNDPVVVEPPPEPPVLEEPEPISEPEDEESWLGAIWAILQTIWKALLSGFSSVVEAVRGVVTALADLAGDIVDGVVAAFEGVFVPEAGYLDAKWATVDSSWESTSPALYVDAVDSITVTGGSDCSGVPLEVTLPGGVDINQNLGRACSGAMASAAGVVRMTLSAVVLVGGLFACVRALGSGLGWDPGIGRGAAQ